jgi:uncharacterized protein YdeI (YjbR/CyaY-like superfamily)
MADPIFFSSPAAFRRWLTRHHAARKELWVGYFKVATGRPSMTWDQSVDEALCFGWIDGVRRSIDAERYMMRFTPRRPRSNWSAKNIASVERLLVEGRMMPAGIEAFEARDASRAATYSFEREAAQLSSEEERKFKASRRAWRHFTSQPPGYQRALVLWVISAKRGETRLRRLERLIEVSGRGDRVELVAPFRDP